MYQDLEQHLCGLGRLAHASLYLEEPLYLISTPLAKEGGVTTWILVHKDHAPGRR
jgi:hypothetical protein